jgi:hypothetical protein
MALLPHPALLMVLLVLLARRKRLRRVVCI